MFRRLPKNQPHFQWFLNLLNLGGLGFGMKWMMGWMHDTLQYVSKEPVYRKHHQNDLTFSMTYAFTENFMLPLSHDEVVYGKRSIIGRMPGDEWQQFANLRLLYSYMFTHPGTNLLFMGSEFGQREEWNFQNSLDWHVLQYQYHKGVKTLITNLNTLYRKHSALYKQQFTSSGFEWISYDDYENSVISYIRKGKDEEDRLIVVCNFTPVIRSDYRIGLPADGELIEIFNSDDQQYGGSGVSNSKSIAIESIDWNYRSYSAEVVIPPLATVVFLIKK